MSTSSKSITLHPKKLSGIVQIPPSKSLAHRAIICAALCKSTDKSKIYNIDFSDDIISTIAAMESLGAVIEKQSDHLLVTGAMGATPQQKRIIDCNESGSTLRFMVPISLLFDGVTNFIGRGNLGKRPLNTFYEIFDRQNIKYTATKDILDLTVEGRLQPDTYYMAGDISSQFISGLMFSLPLLQEDSIIKITTELESKPYLDLTIDALEKFGIKIDNKNYKEFHIKGNQSYKSTDYRVEGDHSQGAFFLSANALGSQISIADLLPESKQADKNVITILQDMGVDIKKDNGLLITTSTNLKNTTIDASQNPDIIPVLSVVAALTPGTTKIINGARLRIKECDRLTAMTTELNKLGANVVEDDTTMTIHGIKEFEGGCHVWSWNDHRIAMSLAIAATRCKKPIVLQDPDCVAKSYPHFYEDYKNLGGHIE